MIKYYNLAVIINTINYKNNSYNKYNEFVDLEGGPNSLKHEELGRSMIPAFDQNQPPPIPRSLIRNTAFQPLISRSFHWQRMCTMFTEALYVPHRDLGRRTQTSPTSPDIYLSARGIKTHTSLRCSMLDRLLVVYPWIIKIYEWNAMKKKMSEQKKM